MEIWVNIWSHRTFGLFDRTSIIDAVLFRVIRMTLKKMVLIRTL
jgi:hypothetical protein